MTSRRPLGHRRGWWRWMARRTALSLLSLLLVSIVVFVVTSALGDPVRAILGREYAASPARVEALRSELDLDQPPLVRYGRWLRGLATGDLGLSLASRQPVADLVGNRVLNSLVLMAIVTVLLVPLGLGLALLTARFRDRWATRVVHAVTVALVGVPEFVIGIALVTLLSTGVWHVLPAVTLTRPGVMPWNQPRSLVLPVVTLLLAIVPYVARMLHTTLVEVLDSAHVSAARLRGVGESALVWRHALPNALAPAVQVIGLQLGWLVGCMAITACYVVVNLAADALTILLSPRARAEVST